MATFNRKNRQQTAETILNALESNGLKAINTHAPYYDLRLSSEIQDENLNEAQMLCLKVSKILGASVCAFHPRTRFTGGENLNLAYLDNIKNFAPLVNEAKKQAGYRGYFTSERNLLSGGLGGEYIKHIYDCLIKIEKLFNEE